MLKVFLRTAIHVVELSGNLDTPQHRSAGTISVSPCSDQHVTNPSARPAFAARSLGTHMHSFREGR